ncbi:MAG: DNA protecting protein DprA [Nitrospirae bacterium GWC2_56_14]|nr:MAG: DNA protecting protein DprA [Nitrospirae bacterium GWC2_56_14]
MQTSNDPALYWIGLSSIPGVGRVTFRKLAQHFGSPERALSASFQELRTISGLSDKVLSAITSYPWREQAEREIAKALEAGIAIIIADDAAYPATLKNIPDPPLFLYVKGDLHQGDCVAIVGTRKPTHYGLTVTSRISSELASAGLTVVSGLARGIDTQAHRGALSSGGRTIAVLGCGIDVVYPPENKDLLEEISRSGAVVTENPFGTQPESGYFPARNRIISGLSRGTVIVEATEDSGSLITAGYAKEQGRKLFAVPGNIGAANSRGSNSLIKQGATLVESARDILQELKIQDAGGKPANAARDLPSLTGDEEPVFRQITNEPKHIDILMKESNTTPAKISGALVTLELKGLVRQLPGKYYIKEA